MKILAFTPTYNRWAFAENCVRTIEAQKPGPFKLVHSIRFLDTPFELVEKTANEHLERVRSNDLIITRGSNGHQYDNAIDAIEAGLALHPDTDLIAKIDDDDFYSLNYFNEVVEAHSGFNFDFSGQSQTNLISLDRNQVYNPQKRMPWGLVGATFVFNRKFYNKLVENRARKKDSPYEDKLWLDLLSPDIKVLHRHNLQQFMYVRHGGNSVTDRALPTIEVK